MSNQMRPIADIHHDHHLSRFAKFLQVVDSPGNLINLGALIDNDPNEVLAMILKELDDRGVPVKVEV